MAELTKEQKLEIMDKWFRKEATPEEIEAAGGPFELMMLLGEVPL